MCLPCPVTLQAGTLEYMAPEVLLKQPVSRASDVYSFAVTLNELATAIVPFSDCTKENPEVSEVPSGRLSLVDHDQKSPPSVSRSNSQSPYLLHTLH